MRRVILVLGAIALCNPLETGAQAAPGDSARRLIRMGDSAYAEGSATQLARARDLRALAIPLLEKSGDRQLRLETLIGLGDALAALAERDSALSTYQRALLATRDLKDRRMEAKALGEIGLVLDDLGRADSATIYHRTALAIRRDIHDSAGEFESLGNIAGVFWGKGRLDSALAYDRLALRLAQSADRRILAQQLSNTGLVHHQLGQLDSARLYYHRALPIWRELGDRRGESRTLNNLGGIFNDIGEEDSALVYFRRSLALRRDVGDRAGQATTLDNIGLSLARLGRFDSALVYHRQALAMARLVGDRRIEGYVLPSIANAFSNMGKPDSAIAYNLAALAMMHEAGDRLDEASTLNNIGVLYLRVSDTASALKYQEQSLALSRDVARPQFEARALDELGNLQRIRGHPDSALVLYQLALARSRGINDRFEETRILENTARVYDRTSRRDLARAAAYYDSAGAVRSFTVRRAGGDVNQVSFLERYVGLFAEWTFAWLARSGEIGSETAALGALTASERGRSQALLNLMRKRSQTDRVGADFVAEGKTLTRPLRRGSEAALVYQATRDTLVIWTIGTEGAVNAFRVNVSYDSLITLVRDVRESLGADGTGRVVAMRGAQLESPDDLPAVVRPSSSRAIRLTGLAAVILPPEVMKHLAGAREIVIVPQGALGMVPFAALPLGPSGEPFGARVALRYAPSLATLATAEGEERAPGAARAAARKSPLVIGNPAMPEVANPTGERGQLAALPGAEAESRETARHLGTSPIVGKAATESAVRGQLPSASVVHLATHGFAYRSESLARRSFVALAPDATNDGLFSVGEILDDSTLKLTAELVVLSACQTGLGNLKQAEGTIGFQRAFLAKGARSVLVSLWNVSDAATRLMMSRFYQHWLDEGDGLSKAEALRLAQRDVRETPGFEHPRFWAGFQLVGAR